MEVTASAPMRSVRQPYAWMVIRGRWCRKEHALFAGIRWPARADLLIRCRFFRTCEGRSTEEISQSNLGSGSPRVARRWLATAVTAGCVDLSPEIWILVYGKDVRLEN